MPAANGHESEPAPVYAEYGLALGAATMEEAFPPRRRGFSFWGRQPIEVDVIGPHSRDDAARAGHGLMNVVAQKEAERTRRVQVLSAGLLIRENKGDWRWVTRLEVTVAPRRTGQPPVKRRRRTRRRRPH